MKQSVQVVTQPFGEPLSLGEVQEHVRQQAGLDDSVLLGLIATVRKMCENQTGHHILGTRLKQVLDGFDYPMHLIRYPFLNLEKIRYLDMGGVWQDVDPNIYVVDKSSEPCRISPAFSRIYPIPRPQAASVEITFIAGFAAVFTVDSVRNAIVIKGVWQQYVVGDSITFSSSRVTEPSGASSPALPAPLVSQTEYFVVEVLAPNVYRIAESKDGTTLTLGTPHADGVCFVGEIPADLCAWMKVRLASLYANREAETDHTATDRLLDAYSGGRLY